MALTLTFPNSSTNPVILNWVEKNLVSTLTRTRKERIPLDERNLRLWHMWDVKLDQPSYLGRSQVYIPVGRAALETWLIALMGGLFPMTEWFGVDAVGADANPDAVARWRALQQQYLDKDLKIQQAAELFLRQYLTFGNGIYRHVWEEREEIRRFYERQLKNAPLDTENEERRFGEREDADDLTIDDGDTVLRLVEKLVKTKCGPSGRVVDFFHFFVKPISAPNIQEAESAWEDLELPLDHLIQQHDRWMDPENESYGRVYDHPEWEQIIASKGKLSDDMLRSRQERWERLQIDVDPNRAYAELEKKSHIQLTEQFWRGEIPEARDEQGRLYGHRDWHIVWVNDTWAVRINPNPFYDQMRPWVDARMHVTANMYYGQGIFHAIAPIQYYLNDVGNLTLDNAVMALSPPVRVDEEKTQVVESLVWAPGAKWYGEQDAFELLNVPTQTQLGMSLMNMLQGLTHDFSGANAANQGVPPARGRGRIAQTATGYSQMQASGAQGFQFTVGKLEREWLVPILERNYQLTQQFSSEKQDIQRLGEDGLHVVTEPVGFEDVFGTYRYTWKGSTAVREKMAMVMGLQSLPQMLQGAPPEVLQAFDWMEFVRLLLVDGYGVSWADRIFKIPKPEESIAPALEHEVMAARRSMRVSPADNDDQHLGDHGVALIEDDRFRRDPKARQLLIEHRTAHEMQKEAKAVQAQQQQMQQAMQALMPPQEEAPQQGSPPNPMNGLGAEPSAEPMADMMRSMQ